jgi:serine/threonine protein phosphatase PrpC
MGSYLSKPEKKKNSFDSKSDSYKYGICDMQGWRLHMEDAHIAIPNFYKDFSLFAVFDGHGNETVAKFSAENFPSIILNNKNFLENNIIQGLEESFMIIDNMLKEESENEKKYFHCGCTVVMLLFSKTKYYVANLGDSRVLLYTKSKRCVSLTIDHKPDVPEEKNRIEQAGGFIRMGRVNGCLNLTRSLGDLHFKQNFNLEPHQQMISGFPEVKEYDIDGDEDFFLIACDGVFDSKSNSDICQRIDMRYNQNPFIHLSVILEDLFDSLLGKSTFDGYGCDNMSGILIKFL